MAASGNNLHRGVEVPALKRHIKWRFTPCVEAGDAVSGGDIIGTVQETEIVQHKIMVPNGMVGTIKSIAPGEFTIEETVAVLQDANGGERALTLMQKWPVRWGDLIKKSCRPICRLSPASG